MVLLLEQQFFQVGEYKVGKVLDRPVEEGIVEDVALDEAETDVDRIEEDDDDPEDEGGHQEAESDAEQFVEPAIKAILSAAYTGEVGDGRIFVSDVIDTWSIRTGEHGETVLRDKK